MTDVHEPEVRSYNMSQIKGKNTKPGMVVRKFLHANSFRYSLHKKDLPGKPDIVFRKQMKAVFINGCFWHRHPGCKRATIPSTRKAFWKKKLTQNRERDLSNIQELQRLNWDVLTVWECELNEIEKVLIKLKSFLGN